MQLRYHPADLEIEVADDGTSAAPAQTRRRQHRRAETSQPGNGLRGMTERARALGGSLDAGPRPGGGFRVLARLPT